MAAVCSSYPPVIGRMFNCVDLKGLGDFMTIVTDEATVNAYIRESERARSRLIQMFSKTHGDEAEVAVDQLIQGMLEDRYEEHLEDHCEP